MDNYKETLLAQYANSPTITGLIDFVNQWIDPGKNLDDFYELVWDVQTAKGFGLDIWGKIVDVSRQLQVTTTSTYTLLDDEYRKLIMVKALANITDCTSPSLNALLGYLFEGQGRAYVNDFGGMQMRYVFEFILTPVELAILLNSRAIPRPAGVLGTILQLPTELTFGFGEAGLQPFGQGTFFNSTELQDAN